MFSFVTILPTMYAFCMAFRKRVHKSKTFINWRIKLQQKGKCRYLMTLKGVRG